MEAKCGEAFSVAEASAAGKRLLFFAVGEA